MTTFEQNIAVMLSSKEKCLWKKNYFYILENPPRKYPNEFISEIPITCTACRKSWTLHKFNKIYGLLPNKNAANVNSTEILQNLQKASKFQHKSSNAILKHQASYCPNLNLAAHTEYFIHFVHTSFNRIF